MSTFALPRPHLDYDIAEMGSRVAWHGRPVPQSDLEWQYAADLAELALLLDSARLYGLVTGGPSVVHTKCDFIIDAAARRGIVPAPPPGLMDAFLAELCAGG